ncbi:MAG TPA: FkbM family methyltransferase [Vicinamibacteria bacterium]|nr:FkbM family methyltransferase [Vicinamibacteria bacterium]
MNGQGPFRLLQVALPERIRVVDVGAHRGDFAAAALAAFPGSSALLFEPGPSKAAALRERYRGEPNVRVFEVALGDEQGDALLHEQEDSATDSLLPSAEVTEAMRRVRVSRLDAVLDEEGVPSVDLVKVDTQGYDLRVLRGAAETLARCHPALLVEAIFVPLYRGQASFDELLAFLTEAGYRLAGVHAVHTDAGGLLAFADFLFLWREPHARLAAAATCGPFTCRDPDVLLDQVDALQKACNERLALIHELTRAAEERLALVHRLDGELRRIQEA